MPVRPAIVAFDIIGTVFSLQPLRERMVALGLPPLALDFVYTATLRDAFAMAATSTYAPFLAGLTASLDEVLAMHGIAATQEQKREVLEAMKVLPAREDAGAAFDALRQAGIAVVALSNGAASATEALLERGGLRGAVARVLSVDDVGLSKPRPEVYRYAAKELGVAPAEMMLVAAHPWDIHGAKVAGLSGGYVERGRPFPPQLHAPDLRGRELQDVATAIAGL
jgi:2-haloacid dehalogenase